MMSGIIKHLTTLLLLLSALVLLIMATTSHGAIPKSTLKVVEEVNKQGPFLGLVVPNSFEMSPLLQSKSFVKDKKLPYLDIGGRRFHLGKVGKDKLIMVMTGLSMVNAGLATQLLLSLFEIKGVVHFGIAGNANPELQIGDVTIPQYWAHTGLWNWQRYGEGPQNELALEAGGDYTRKYGYLNISYYSTNKIDKSSGNFLNNVWYQPEEIFPVNGVPEVREHAFWVPVDEKYFALSKQLEGMELPKCANSTTCLPRNPKVVRVERGCSANAFVDNAAYRKFLRSKFNVTPVDMESAAVALVCRQLETPFVAIRALSDLAGGGSAQSNEADVFAPLAAHNAVDVVLKFLALLTS
ncbi:bark storage protein A-like [Ananas comosus]|uniref:Bark storage protein A-like n=1 Tax=Ananas comosus TaxID=4615 RepID=A0A6P5FWU6_ANACO|nr:bark storage protein A-like [Ananas comosus]